MRNFLKKYYQLLLTREVSSASLVSFRIIFGAVMFFSILRFAANGWIQEFYIKPSFFFTYYGFDWISPFSETGMYLVFGTLALTSLCIALGYFYRTATILFFILFTYVELIDKTYYLNHYYFISVVSFLLIFIPAQRGLSLDFGLKKLGTVPVWTLNILILQLGIVYFFAGVAKIQSDWLIEALPLKIWLPGRSHFPVIGELLSKEWTAYVFSWGGMIYDISIPFLLLISRTRPIAYATVILFHIATWVLFPIGMFPFIMIGLTTLFFPVDTHIKFWNKIFKNIQGSMIPTTVKIPRAILFGLPVFILFQLFIPLRSLAYPGNLFWTEQGYRFSWRVMLMEKSGMCDCVVNSEELTKPIEIDNRKYLSMAQERMMSTQPDMILQYAHFIRDKHKEVGLKNPQVFADCQVSLQGKRSRPFIDKTVNLASVERGFSHKNWILPLEK